MNDQLRKLLGSLCLILLCLSVYAQEYSREGWIMYERGFEFNKGIYLSFEEFRNNDPSIRQEFEKRNGEMYVKNDSLNKWQPLRKQNWGYSNGRNIFVRAYNGYTRVGMIGELSHLVITSSVTPGASIALSSAGGVGIGMGSGTAATQEFLLDFQTGKFIEFTRKNFEALLKHRDPLMYEQYKKRKGKKKEKMHLYLNAYNDAHPIYFPE